MSLGATTTDLTVCIRCLRSWRWWKQPGKLSLLFQDDVLKGLHCSICKSAETCQEYKETAVILPMANLPPVPTPGEVSDDEWCRMIDDPEQE